MNDIYACSSVVSKWGTCIFEKKLSPCARVTIRTNQKLARLNLETPMIWSLCANHVSRIALTCSSSWCDSLYAQSNLFSYSLEPFYSEYIQKKTNNSYNMTMSCRTLVTWSLEWEMSHLLWDVIEFTNKVASCTYFEGNKFTS